MLGCARLWLGISIPTPAVPSGWITPLNSAGIRVARSRPTPTSTVFRTSRININDFRTDYEDFSAKLPDEFFPKGADWMQVGPTGPRRLRLAVEHLAQFRGGICFMLDLDPRWFIKTLKMGHPD